MTTLALIPARAGSKRVRNKNLTPVPEGGPPLISWTVWAALHAETVDRVIVSTEDESIAAAARRCGERVEIINRPAVLADDDATTEDVIAHALCTTGPVDTVVLLQCTSPLRTHTRIDEAVRLLEETEADTVIGGMNDAGAFFTWAWMGDDLTIRPDHDERPRTQDLRVFRETGCLYAFRFSSWLKHWNRLGTKCVPLVMESYEALDIDTNDDVKVASYWMAACLRMRGKPYARYLGADPRYGESEGTDGR